MKKKQKFVHLAAWCTLGMFIIYCILMYSITGGICPFRGLFGIPCPACGSTRAMIRFAKGDFIGGMRMNPSAPLLFLLLVNEIRVSYFRRGNKKAAMLLLVTSVTVSLAVYLVRMRLYFPHMEPYIIERRSLLFRILHLYLT